MKSRIYTIIGIIVLLVIGSGIITYTQRDSSLYVLAKVNKKGQKTVLINPRGAYWVTIKEIANLEQGYEMIIWYHNGTVEFSEIDFSDNSTTLVGYEKVYYQNYAGARGFTLLDDHMDGFNTKIDTVRELFSCLSRGGKLTW